MDEWEQIAWIRSQIAGRPDVPIGIGDDAALLKVDPNLLIAVDMLIEGVHFDLGQCTPYQVGRKAMNVNLSDIAAMAGRPTFALVAVALPKNKPADLAGELFRGLREAAEAFDVTIVGGDTNRAASDLAVSVTVLGAPTEMGPLTRAGAKPSDVLFVTGALGYSLDGKHLDFIPRLREAALLHQRYRLTSMIDISDGLGSDVFHIVHESGCGAEIDAEAIPLRPHASIESDPRTPLEHALHDGEDFELLFSVEPEDAERIERDKPLALFGLEVTRIGVMTQEQTVRLRTGDRIEKLQRGGFQHEW